VYEVEQRRSLFSTNDEAEALRAAVVSASKGVAATVLGAENEPVWSAVMDTKYDDSEPFYPVTVVFHGQSLDELGPTALPGRHYDGKSEHRPGSDKS
jgi:hypothetical protein